MDAAWLLEGLDPDQRDAVMTDAAPLAILAPAGSGKTRVLCHRVARRIADGSADTRHMLAITFTRRAAGELQRRLERLGLRDRPTAGTFHRVAWAVLTQRWADTDRPRPELLPDPDRLLGPLLESRRGGGRAAARTRDLGAEIDWARARRVSADRYPSEGRAHGRRPPIPPETVAELMTEYTALKRRRRLVDFDDLLELCALELERDREFAAAQRWRFRHFFVDEFQDVNPLQFRLLEAWRGGRPDLCVVGDPDQAIYGWNGADPGLLAHFAELVGGATIVRLRSTYRSTPQVVAAARAVLPGPGHATPARADGPLPRVHELPDHEAEAAAIARLLRDRRPGRRWSSCAVLVRTHAQLAVLEQALAGAGIPARRRYDRPLLDGPTVQAVLRDANSYASLTQLVDALEAQVAEADAPPSSELVQLLALGHELLAQAPGAAATALRAWLLAGGADERGASDAVELVTFHAAKGLEWPVVVVAGLEAGLVPHASAVTDEARAEEARLLYVALSRAEDELHVTWARARGSGPRRARRPSPFLPGLLAAVEPEPASPPPAGLRAESRAGSPPGDPLLATLRRWRSSAARAADLPEHAICTDEDLAVLAHQRPSDEAGLAAVLGPLAARRLAPRLLALLADG